MQGWLLYSQKDAEQNRSYIDWFIDEAQKEDIELRLIVREQLDVGFETGRLLWRYEGDAITLPTFAVVRTVEPFLQRLLEDVGVLTFNSFSIAQTTNDKRLTYFEMQKLGIPIVDTYFTTAYSFPESPPLNFPLVVKEATGRGGKEVFYITSEDEWNRVLEHISSNELVIQRANVKLGRDIRVFVIGKEIIAAILRKSDHDFRANFTLGGTAELYELSEEEQSLVKKILEHFDFGFVGIDFLISEDGNLLFNEIEDVVGSRTLSSTTDINVLEKYVKFIKKRVLETI